MNKDRYEKLKIIRDLRCVKCGKLLSPNKRPQRLLTPLYCASCARVKYLDSYDVNGFRYCNLCNNLKPLNEYYPVTKTRYERRCKSCVSDVRSINRLLKLLVDSINKD